MTSFEDEYLDVLQNIEFAILQVYHSTPTLVDYDVEKALDALIRTYKRPPHRPAPKWRSTPSAEEVFVAVKEMCDWRLGSDVPGMFDNFVLPAEMEPLSVDEILACLKRIRKSVQTWNKRSGRQGYLEFIDQYVG
jgi:hypothetical protein